MRSMFIAMATPIGRAALEVSGRGKLGNQIFTLLEGSSGKMSKLAPGREAGKWMRVCSEGRAPDADKVAVSGSVSVLILRTKSRMR